MAVQRISWFEQNVEKLLVGVFGAGLLGVLVWQLAGSKNTIEVGSKKDVAIDQAYNELEKSATTLKSQMTRSQVDGLPEPSKLGLKESFEQKLAGAVAPRPTLPWTPAGWRVPGTDAGSIIENKVAGKFDVPVIPAPSQATAFAFVSTIHPDEISAIETSDPAGRKLFPAKAPFDKAAVSVQASFPGLELKAALEKRAANDGPAISRTLWENIQIARVDLERQEQLADGTWGEIVTVAPMPGRFNLSKEIEKGPWTLQNIADLITQSATNSKAILTPEYYKRAELNGHSLGEEWKTPDEAVADNLAGANKALNLSRQLKELNEQLNRAKAERQREANRPTPGGGGGGAGGGGGRAGGGGLGVGGGGSGGGGGGGGGKGSGDAKAQRLKQLDDLIAKLEAKKKKLEDDLKALNAKPVETPKADDIKDRNISAILLSDVSFWSHDVTAIRGKNYRYRLSVAVTNPLMGQERNLAPADKDVSKKPVLVSTAGEWSDAVRVPDETYYFITSASTADNKINRGVPTPSARAEMFVFTWGYWRKGEASMEPGDVLATKISIPDADEIVKLAAKPAAAPPVTPNPAPAPGPGGKPGVNNPPVPKPPVQEKVPTIEIEVARELYLLDVVSPDKSNPKNPITNAYLRDEAGTIITRLPEKERVSLEYQRVEASARLGVEKLNELLTPADPNANPQNPGNPGMNPGGGRPGPGRGGASGVGGGG